MLVAAVLQLLCPVLRRVLGDRGIHFHQGPADGRERGEPRPHRQFHLCSLAASVGPDCRGHSAGQLQLQVLQHPADLPGEHDRSLRPPRQPARDPLLVLNSWRELQHQQGMHNPAGGAGAGLPVSIGPGVVGVCSHQASMGAVAVVDQWVRRAERTCRGGAWRGRIHPTRARMTGGETPKPAELIEL